MNDALKVQGLCKRYPSFTLEPLDFTIPCGCVLGVVGENGAGKTTLIRSILGMTQVDGGEIHLFGEQVGEKGKGRVGFVSEDACVLDTMNAQDAARLFGYAYAAWDDGRFETLLKQLDIDPKKKLKAYSKGMKIKLSIAAALSHDAQLLVMDEPTSGLDPVARAQVLDLFYDYMQDERHAILFSSHITSDLDKIADRVLMLHRGRKLLDQPRDRLLDAYGVLHCTTEQKNALDPKAIRAAKQGAFGWEVLLERAAIPQGAAAEPASIEQIMLLLIEEGTR